MKKIISALLLSAMLTSTLASLVPVSADVEGKTSGSNVPDEQLFFTSFENDESIAPLLSTPVSDDYVGLDRIVETNKTDGLAIDLSTVGGSSDFKSSEGKLCLFDGDTVTCSCYDMIRPTFDYDFSQEKGTGYPSMP